MDKSTECSKYSTGDSSVGFEGQRADQKEGGQKRLPGEGYKELPLQQLQRRLQRVPQAPRLHDHSCEPST